MCGTATVYKLKPLILSTLPLTPQGMPQRLVQSPVLSLKNSLLITEHHGLKKLSTQNLETICDSSNNVLYFVEQNIHSLQI